jgi:hypothetical protein
VLDQFGVKPEWALLVRGARWGSGGLKPPAAHGGAPQMDPHARPDVEPAGLAH